MSDLQTLLNTLKSKASTVGQAKLVLKIKKGAWHLGCFLYRVTYKKLQKKLKTYPWYNQLEEASRYNTKTTTFVSSFFISLLSLAFPLSLMQVYDRIIPNQTFSTLIFLFAGVSIAIILEAVLQILRSYINLWSDTKYEFEMSKKALNNLMHLPLYEYEKTDMGTRIKQFAILDYLRGFYNSQLFVSICEIPFLIIFLIVIAYISGWLVLVPLALSLGLLLVSLMFVKKWQDFLNKKLMQESREGDFYVNVLNNIHSTKSLGIENLLIRRYERLQDTSDKINFDSSVQQGDLNTLKAIVSQANMVMMGSVGALVVMSGQIPVGSLIACILLSSRFMMPLVRLVSSFSKWKMINIIRAQLDIVLKASVSVNEQPIELTGSVALKNIGYSYKTKEGLVWLLKDLNLEVPPLTTVAIVGGMQEQQDILLNILGAITKPTIGDYFIDGKNVAKYHNFELRSKVAYLSKVGILFHGSIMSNLSAFNEEYVSLAREYSKKLGLDKIISRLPSGYDTLVGDKAVEALPGGIISMIFVIRALVNKPMVILFDEFNMNLDIASTKKLIALLTDLKNTATIIMLSKTNQTTGFSDVVYEINDMQLTKRA